jgi:zinc protease
MDQKKYREVLDNKLKILMVPIKNVDTISVGICIKVGSRYETESENGICAFLYYLFYTYTEALLKEKAKVEKQLGSTDKENTFFDVHGDKKYVQDYINLMSELYKNPVFTAKDVDQERGRLLEIYHNEIGNTQNEVDKMVLDTIYPGCSYNNLLNGTEENIAKLKYDNIMEFRRKYYVPERTVIVIAGNFNVEKIREFTINKFKDMKGSTEILTFPEPCKYIETTPKIVLQSVNLLTSFIEITFKTESVYSDNTSIYDLIADILARGRSSKLNKLLRKKLGITYGSESWNQASLSEGHFRISVKLENKHVRNAINNIIKELKHIKDEGITEDEFKKARNSKITRIEMIHQTSYYVLLFSGIQELDYKTGPVPKDTQDRTKMSNIIKFYKSLTLKKVNEVMRDMFKADKMCIIVYGGFGKLDWKEVDINI